MGSSTTSVAASPSSPMILERHEASVLLPFLALTGTTIRGRPALAAISSCRAGTVRAR
jgi:hypothetical protein